MAIQEKQFATSTTIHLSMPDLGLPSKSLTFPTNVPLSHLKSHLLPETLTLTPSSFYLCSNGKPLSDSSTLSAPGPHHLTLRLRLRGGGGDGGATGAESRDCYLNMYAVKKPDKVDPNETRISRWTTCALSGEPLAPPVVLDRLGSLYNKEALVEALLHKRLPRALRHIRGLKDMLPVHLHFAPGNETEVKFQCPVTGLEFNGKYPFFAIRSCGHVLSAKALKEVKSSACLVCHKEFEESDKIVINGSQEEVGVLRERLEEEKGKVKEKKEKKVGMNGNGLSGSKHVSDESGEAVLVNGKKRFKAMDIAPANATKEIYASLFTSSKKGNFKETYSCRSLPLGRN